MSVPHAYERYLEHHPHATYDQMFADMDAAEVLEHDLFNALTGRTKTAHQNDEYRLAADKRGAFVLNAGRLITYIRFSERAAAILGPQKAHPASNKTLKKQAQAKLRDIFGSLPVVWSDADRRNDALWAILKPDDCDGDQTQAYWRRGDLTVKTWLDDSRIQVEWT